MKVTKEEKDGKVVLVMKSKGNERKIMSLKIGQKLTLISSRDDGKERILKFNIN